MTKRYRVLVRQDAWINHEAIVEAETPEEAAEKVKQAWKQGDKSIEFELVGETEFDEILVDPDEVEEVE